MSNAFSSKTTCYSITILNKRMWSNTKYIVLVEMAVELYRMSLLESNLNMKEIRYRSFYWNLETRKLKYEHVCLNLKMKGLTYRHCLKKWRFNQTKLCWNKPTTIKKQIFNSAKISKLIKDEHWIINKIKIKR